MATKRRNTRKTKKHRRTKRIGGATSSDTELKAAVEKKLNELTSDELWDMYMSKAKNGKCDDINAKVYPLTTLRNSACGYNNR